jgi:hypothetical protein
MRTWTNRSWSQRANAAVRPAMIGQTNQAILILRTREIRRTTSTTELRSTIPLLNIPAVANRECRAKVRGQSMNKPGSRFTECSEVLSLSKKKAIDFIAIDDAPCLQLGLCGDMHKMQTVVLGQMNIRDQKGGSALNQFPCRAEIGARYNRVAPFATELFKPRFTRIDNERTLDHLRSPGEVYRFSSTKQARVARLCEINREACVDFTTMPAQNSAE